MAREYLGDIPCLCCGRTIPVHRLDKGGLNLTCSWCGLPAYTRKDDKATEIILARLPQPEPKPAPAAAPKVEPTPAPAPIPAPAPKPAPKPTLFG